MTIPIDTIVDVDVSISSGASRTREFQTLFLTNDRGILDGAGAGKVRSYDGANDIEAGYSQDVKDAAVAYYSQTQYPNTLHVGRWIDQTANSETLGGAPDTVDEIKKISDGSFQFAGIDFTGVDFTGDSSYANIATTVQTALRADDAIDMETTFTHDAANSRFILSFPPSLIGDFLAPHSGGTGTDVSTLLGMTEATGASNVLGAEAESLTDALNAISIIANDIFCVVLANTWANNVAVQAEAVQWATANGGLAVSDTSGDGALNGNENTSPTAQVAALASNGSVVNWSQTLDYKNMSVAGFICSRNLDAPLSAYTMKFKQLQGRRPDVITASQKRELTRKRVNVYASYQGNRAFYGEGMVTGNYQWIDIPVYAAWFADRMQSDILGYLSAPDTKVPQSAEGVNGLLGEMDAICLAAVQNGGVAPGLLTARQRQQVIQATGDMTFDGNLTSGYLNHVAPLSTQSQAKRESRITPPSYSWIKLSGAMHEAVIGVKVEQ